MMYTFAFTVPRRRAAIIALGVLLLGTTIASGVRAQAIVAIVNGAPISTMDVQNRMNLMRISGDPVTKKQVVDELVEERLKMLEARRVNLLPTDLEVEVAFASIAKRSKLTAAQLTQALSQRGVNASTLKARIRSEMGWGQFVRQKFRATSVVREQDVVAAMGKPDKTAAANAKAYTYIVREVVFVLPKDASEARINQRRQEAGAARLRFKGCDQGLPFLKGLRDVAVKEPISRAGLSLSPALREELEKTGVGNLTPPDKGDNGIEMLAICERKEGSGTSALQEITEEKLKDEQLTVQERKYLNDLKMRAVIEYR